MNYLFVVAHPDDESGAAGGTIYRLVQQGHRVAVAIMVSQAAARLNRSSTLEPIVTHHPTDTNNDHAMTSGAAQAACRLFQRRPTDYRLHLVMYMETPSATDWSLDSSANRFTPNCFVEIGQEGLDAKLRAMAEYKGVMRPYPHPRSEENYRGLAAYRGAQAGLCYAEAFEIAFEAR